MASYEVIGPVTIDTNKGETVEVWEMRPRAAAGPSVYFRTDNYQRVYLRTKMTGKSY